MISGSSLTASCLTWPNVVLARHITSWRIHLSILVLIFLSHSLPFHSLRCARIQMRSYTRYYCISIDRSIPRPFTRVNLTLLLLPLFLLMDHTSRCINNYFNNTYQLHLLCGISNNSYISTNSVIIPSHMVAQAPIRVQLAPIGPVAPIGYPSGAGPYGLPGPLCQTGPPYGLPGPI